MVADNKGKKLKVAEKGEEDNNQIDEELVLSIEKLQEIQDDLEKINEEASDKVLEVEQKYNEIRKPVYDKRNEIIKSIPDFWLTAFLSHHTLGTLLTEEDQKIFKFLSSLQVEDSKDVKSGYSITFYFEPNPYFEETKLIKSFAFLDEGTTEITATPISWKEGMGPPNGVSHENKGKKRLLAYESFLSWFSNTQPKCTIDDLQDEVSRISSLEISYVIKLLQVAEIIKEDLWPNPLSYFNTDPYIEDSDEDEADEGIPLLHRKLADTMVGL
ncbi:hypothetical protein SADUNF_Sadunf12G0051900 [Salix dunnii]|uniref:Uncharacterized protein n=1 Tax=Salix dunnii TaxID=1413687 RepID=A0A835JMX8_9ROSI|nr:hypothetical protein SADUNF_Sadunf12G0051900 [Salix dunnii]